MLYDKNAGNQVVEVAPIELNSLQADAPSRWQEAYNIYVLNDNTNHRAREAFDKGWITFQSTQRIYMNALHQTRVLCCQGQLSHTYLRHMLSYGKFYGYISPLLIHRMTYGEFDLISLIIGVVVGILIIIALMYRLCCYKKKSHLERPLKHTILQVTQVDVVRIPLTGASFP